MAKNRLKQRLERDTIKNSNFKLRSEEMQRRAAERTAERDSSYDRRVLRLKKIRDGQI